MDQFLRVGADQLFSGVDTASCITAITARSIFRCGTRIVSRPPALRHRSGSQGDAFDNALAESVIGLYKTEVIRRRGPWHTLEAVEFATLEWVDWFNMRRLLGPTGDVPPAEFEAQYI